MENKSDLEIAIMFFQEETEGIKDYEYYIATCENVDLKNMLQQILADEKKHSSALLAFINKQAQGYLK